MMILPDMSIKEFDSLIDNISQQHNISDMTTKYKDVLLELGAPKPKVEEGRFDDILTEWMSCPKNMNKIHDLAKQTGSLYERFGYWHYLQLCSDLQKKFYSHRIENPIFKIASVMDLDVPLGYGLTEKYFVEWLNRLVEKESKKGNYVRIKFESIDGDVYQIDIVANSDIEWNDDGDVIAKPKSFWRGDHAISSIKFEHFWDINDKRWYPIPIQLIQNISVGKLDDDDDDDMNNMDGKTYEF